MAGVSAAIRLATLQAEIVFGKILRQLIFIPAFLRVLSENDGRSTRTSRKTQRDPGTVDAVSKRTSQTVKIGAFSYLFMTVFVTIITKEFNVSRETSGSTGQSNCTCTLLYNFDSYHD